MATKVELDLRVAAATRVPRAAVTKITKEFLLELRDALVFEGEVVLPGIGRLYVSEYKGNNANLESSGGKRAVVGPTHLRVFFRKAPALREALKRRKR